ncbi:DUF4190 domain-containing protein [Aeromicrobium sp. NPDC092404]|uniref:DUF4190 domain-containing protein n=1 Tax=Aeromicrobium sp. NPDC092404 TaxID=3154976 RepID=UPI00342E5CF7
MTTNEPPPAHGEPDPSSGLPGDGAGLPTNRKAIYSVLYGAAAFPCAFLVPFLAAVLSVPAITCGVHARREIKESKGQEDGDLVAVIGLTIGATTLALVVLATVASPLLP